MQISEVLSTFHHRRLRREPMGRRRVGERRKGERRTGRLLLFPGGERRLNGERRSGEDRRRLEDRRRNPVRRHQPAPDGSGICIFCGLSEKDWTDRNCPLIKGSPAEEYAAGPGS